jgi:hypothetical protein
MDELEKQIRENKFLFDEHRADKSKIWKSIEANLDSMEPKVIPLWRSPKFRVAAGIAIVVGLFFMFNFLNVEKREYSVKNSETNQELQDVDVYYSNLVAYQVQLLQNSSKLSSEEKKEFLLFMDELDIEYDELKLELKKNINNEFILEAIIKNYKKRIELIENLLHQINESKKTPNENEYIL